MTKPPVVDGGPEILIPVYVASARKGRNDGSPAGGTPLFVGPENRLVEAVAAALLGPEPADGYPIVVHGGTGTGKTHLAMGLVDIYRICYPHRRAEYATCTDFARELNDSMEAQAVEEFRSKYRAADLLVVEDIHAAAGRRACQEELLHTLDAVLEGGGRMLLTCRSSPAEMRELLPGLRSRLQAGLTVKLVGPGAATRLTILRETARGRGVALAETAAELLAHGLVGTVPELLGALTQLEVHAQLEGGTIDAERVRQFLASRQRACPRIQEIAAATARKFSVRVADLRSASRRQAVVTARAVAMHLARRLTEQSLQRIGQYFGGRDHTTVIHNCRKAERLVKTDAALRDAVGQLRQRWEPSQ